MTTIGIDLGTSAMKLLLVDGEGKVLRQVTREYPLSIPEPGWSEQRPEDWWEAVLSGIPELTAGGAAGDVRAIGLGGQMHGLVALDGQDRVIRPAILWNDGRTAQETAYLNQVIGRERLAQYTGNIAFAGFTAPKLLWMRDREPENFRRIAKIMLPKDYITYQLTGVHATDYSDASGTLLLDVKNRCWSREMCQICGISEDILPRLFPSAQAVGTLRPHVARRLGLSPDVLVCAGAGDNAAAAVGTGTVGAGRCNISLGTSGTIFIALDGFRADPNNALHAFAHADGGWHLMGCMLTAAGCNRWWMDGVSGDTDYAAEQARIPRERLGENRVFFLPYLMGERSPINDVDARGVFTGLSLDTTHADMTQAVLEGVAFAIRDSLEVARSLGIGIRRSGICGGGAKSPLWREILANVLGIPLDMAVTEQGPGYGGAILAMAAAGAFPSVREASLSLAGTASTTWPDEKLISLYDRRYAMFREIYPAMRQVFRSFAQA